MAEEARRNVKKFERLWWIQKVGVPPHSTCNRRTMTTKAWVRRFARKVKCKNVNLWIFHTYLHVQNQLADLSELSQHSATRHKHIRQINTAPSMYPRDKSRFKWETTKVHLHMFAMLSSCIWLLSYQLNTWYNPEGRPGMSNVTLLSGLSRLSFVSPFLSPLLFFLPSRFALSAVSFFC